MFTHSTAAMARLTNDAPGPGQEIARRIIELAQRVIDWGNTVTTIRWTPAHKGVEANEQDDQRAMEPAALPLSRTTTRHYSLVSLQRRATEQSTRIW